ncbi:hypothetical protein LXL04_013212 [Taraxacum kok-saghyz]
MLLVSTRITLALSSPYFLRISFQIPNSLFRSDFSLDLLIMDALDSVFEPLREFSKDSYRLVKRCHKPDRKEFSKVAVPHLHPYQQHNCRICLEVIQSSRDRCRTIVVWLRSMMYCRVLFWFYVEVERDLLPNTLNL